MSREVRRSALVAVPIERMFEVIDRVEDYPAFLPWCVAAHDVERSESMVAATVEVGWKHLHFKVRTRNPKTPPTQMEIHLEDGSFRHFSGRWDLKPLGARGCRVEFLLSYELAIPGAAAVAGAAIDHAADRMVDAFLERAEALAPGSPEGLALVQSVPVADSANPAEGGPRAEPAPPDHPREEGGPPVARAMPASAVINATQPSDPAVAVNATLLPDPIPAASNACQDSALADPVLSRSTVDSPERSKS